MSLIRPFRGVRFSPSAGEMSDLMAPPYDVIDDHFRDELYGRSEHNIVRISKSKEIENEELQDHYKTATKTWGGWRESGATLRDSEPSFYFYEQEFQIRGETFFRLGLVGAHKLVEFGQGVLPHEKTLSGPKEDRHRLLKQTKTHFGQIFALYSDEGGDIDSQLRDIYSKAEELYQATDKDGVIHRLKKTSDKEEVQKISSLFEGKEMIIADGHHRYETALKFSKELGTIEASHLMMTMVSLANPGLLILPTHRLVKNIENWKVAHLVGALEENFDVRFLKCDVMNKEDKKKETLAAMSEFYQQGKSALGLYSPEGFHIFVKKDGVVPEVEGSDVFKALDVVTLHKLILEDHLGIDQQKLAEQTNVEYIKDSGTAIDESIAKVDSGSHQGVFLMNPTPIDQTEQVAKNGEKMPQKSTFFHPKVYTGLVTYSIESGVLEN